MLGFSSGWFPGLALDLCDDLGPWLNLAIISCPVHLALVPVWCETRERQLFPRGCEATLCLCVRGKTFFPKWEPMWVFFLFFFFFLIYFLLGLLALEKESHMS